jgi:hypothetical protein
VASISRKGEVVRVQLRPEERALLVGFSEEVAALLEPESSDDDPLSTLVGMSDAPVVPPGGPELARLLPAAYTDDDDKASEFRRLTDLDLRRRKGDALHRLAGTLRASADRHDLDVAGAESWLQAVNDIRLVLGVRLDVQEDTLDAIDDLPPDDPKLPLLAAYDWLTALQETLLRCLPEDDPH